MAVPFSGFEPCCCVSHWKAGVYVACFSRGVLKVLSFLFMFSCMAHTSAACSLLVKT